jgi:sulfur-oxidizing protein SoxY
MMSDKIARSAKRGSGEVGCDDGRGRRGLAGIGGTAMTMRLSLVPLALLLLAATLSPAAAEMDEAARGERWAELRHALFGEHPITDASSSLHIDAPDRADNAALVPVAIHIDAPLAVAVRTLYFVIDNNPSPLAATFRFGPLADASGVATRVRIDDYTYMHAVAETADGTLYAAERFIKAAGGCSAPAGNDPALALARLGKMKLAVAPSPPMTRPVWAQLLISHPNSSGLQMDQVTRNFIPADFIQKIRISYAGKDVLTVESDIALSEDPSLRFAFTPREPGEVSVEVEDSSQRHFQQSWPLAFASE